MFCIKNIKSTVLKSFQNNLKPFENNLLLTKNLKLWKKVGIWIDSNKAIIVTLDGQKEEKITEIDSEAENSFITIKKATKKPFPEAVTATAKQNLTIEKMNKWIVF